VALPKNIGIKLFDDTFVPVLSENEIKSKKLTLTTVKDGQKKAIIELYEGTSDKCVNNEYLGKLVVSIDRKTVKGGPGLEVNLRLSEDGILFAKAWDSESGTESEISIEHAVSQRLKHEIMSNDEIDTMGNGEKQKIESYDEDLFNGDDSEKTSFFPVIRIILAVLIIVVIIALLGFCGFFIYNNATKYFEEKKLNSTKKTNEIKKIDNQNKKIEKTVKDEPKKIVSENKPKEVVKKKEEPKKDLFATKKTTDSTKKKDLPVKSKEVVGVKDISGKKHFIRRGENLWNICKKYYNDPWFYPSLAEKNNLKSPRKIIAGTYLVIPSKTELKRWDFKK